MTRSKDRSNGGTKRNVAQWDAAVKFFQANHKFLKDWRNDIGGHFLAIQALLDIMVLVDSFRRNEDARREGSEM